jgi:penicillin-binding protein 2
MADVPRLRLGVLAVVVVSMFSVLFARLWYLQILTSPDFSRVATVNKLRVVQIPPTRGRILDRNGVVLAGNKASDVITIDRKEIRNTARRKQLFDRVANVLETNPELAAKRSAGFERRFNDQRYQELDALPLAEGITDRQAIYLRERVEDFPGLDVRETEVRTYPFGSLAAHVIGYVGRITPDNKTQYLDKDPPYQLSDIVGVTGIERVYEGELRGSPGSITYEVDANSRVLARVSEVLPIPGNDVVLTIDAKVQALAESSLRDEIEYRRTQYPTLPKAQTDLGLVAADTFKAPGGSAVVQDPTNGDLLALASYPTFDLRELANGITATRAAFLNCSKELQAANVCDKQTAPLLNRAVQGLYAPGSTFKLISATAALSTQLLASDQTIDDPGKYDIPSCIVQPCTLHNASDQPHGKVNITDALTVSSDVFFYNVGYLFRYGKSVFGNAIQDTADLYGFGKATGVQLPSERNGFVPTDDSIKKRAQANPGVFSKKEFTLGDNISLAVGQGDLLATPLQISNAYSSFANGGHVFSPNVVSRVTAPPTTDDQLGMTLRAVGPRELNTKLALPAVVRDPILTGLTGVTTRSSGTAYRTFTGFPLPFIPVAGKTGTAQTGTNKSADDTSLFASFAPANAPRYAVTVVIERAGFGAQAAAPVARLLLESLFGVGTCKAALPAELPPYDPGTPVEQPPHLALTCPLAGASQVDLLKD